MKLEGIMRISDLGVVIGSLTLAFGLFQYYKAQRWKRAEWVATQIKEFRLQGGVYIALRLIEWQERDLRILPFDDKKNGVVHVTSVMIKTALDPENEGCDEVEVALRDAFNELIEGFERFENFVQSGLVSTRELKPYLEYYLEVLADKDSEKVWRATFWEYVNAYFSDNVPRFFRRFGYEAPRHKSQ